MADLLLDDEIGVIGSPAEIAAIGHRVVHGGERFSQPIVITDEVKASDRALSSPWLRCTTRPISPASRSPRNSSPMPRRWPSSTRPFTRACPPQAYRYAMPNRLYEEHGMRVYGFHGTSHLYVTKQAIAYLGKPAAETNLITAHLGNGCSITAVQGGQSIDTSMGFSPLAGLIMGTRSGDIDPALPYFLGEQPRACPSPKSTACSTSKAACWASPGKTTCARLKRRQMKGDADAQLALDMYAYRIKKYIGAYMAALGRVDALVFTAGVGEHSDIVRALVCHGLDAYGITLDPEKNRQGPSGAVTEIQAAGAAVKILIIPTNEELEIASQTKDLVA